MELRDSVLLDIGPTEIAEGKRTKLIHIYQLIRHFNNACDQKNLFQIKKLQSTKSALQNISIETVTQDTLSKSKTRNDFRNHVIDLIVDGAYIECQDDNNELLFFASAKFALNRLQETLKELGKDPDNYSEAINQTRYSDSVIIFLLKYGNLNDENFFNCIKILTEAGVDVNTFDIKGKTGIDYVAALYHNIHDNAVARETLKNIAQLFLDKGIFEPDNKNTLEFLTNAMKIDVEKYEFTMISEKNKLFYWLIKNKTDSFLNFKNIKKYVDADNGEHTLLQLACKRTNMVPVVQFLLKNGADPNKVTKSNQHTPLELAALNNNRKIFEELLGNKKTEINQKQYNNFVRWRSQSMRPKLFEILLESNKLNPNFTYDKTGNTPLHYAIFFCHKQAVQNLLKRHSSLIVKNKFGVRALDIIDSEDLEKYFDWCLALDNYTNYFSDPNHKMRFRFNCLVDVQCSREVSVISKIGKRPNLEYLLMHPFIHTFICLKWFRVELYFWLILAVQALMFLLLSILFYRLPFCTIGEFVFCIFLAVVNSGLKAPIFLYFNIKQSRPLLFALNRLALHSFLEVVLIITMIGSFWQTQFRAFVFVEMAVSFLLTAGYHPDLSKWSLMLQQVFKSFTILLIFFSLIVVAFAVGFHILFPKDGFFQDVLSSIFSTFVMTTGEIDVEDDMGFDSAGFAGYLLFCLFAMSVCLVIVNFWTGVAVTDIERIEKNSEINASKNVIIFMSFIDFIYSLKYFAKLRKYIPSPLLFVCLNDDGFISRNAKSRYEINFYVNKEKQFEGKVGLPTQVDIDCFTKIRSHYHKLKKVSKEKEILTKLESLSKMLAEIKSNCM